VTTRVAALGKDHMTHLNKFTNGLACVALALSVPMFASARGPDTAIEATHVVSSGRIVNTVADMSADDQAQGRAAIWAFTGQAAVPSCAACGDTFQTSTQ
jgi:hypothetical protein